MTRSSQAWLKFIATRLAGLALDSAMLALAYWGAFALRFDFQPPRWGWRAVALSFVSVAVAHLVALVVTGCYRLAWRRFALREMPRYLLAMALAAAALTLLRMLMPFGSFSHVRPPYSITLITFFMASLLLMGWRIVWSWLMQALVRESDLLSRQVRRMDASVAADFLRGKTVLVTGAGGSIGSELVRQVALAAPKLLLLVERSENALYEIDRELRQRGVSVPTKPLMVDINDGERMRELFDAFRPELVLHAAAYKHVPMVEMNPAEGERNNTVATRQLAELARQFGVQRFVLISTDKAVNPISVMGKTKLAAERAIMALNADDSPTSFCAVRFGNVLGSSGSVVPLFREQIAKRLPVTVTHPGMKRYFMTVEEAVGLVLQAASRSEKAIYTLDMGEPVRIVDLAEEMIRQAGYKPYVDIPIVFTGIRPGEKLFEELDISEKSAYKTDMARIYITKAMAWAIMLLGGWALAAETDPSTLAFDVGADLRIRQELMENVPGLPGGGLSTPARPGDFRQHMRFRPRVWAEVKGDAGELGRWRIWTRLTDEFRWAPEPNVDTHTFPDELVLDNLFVEGKGVFDGFLDLRIGRQDLWGYCGLDHVFGDGNPGDGSRSTYTDMAAFKLHFTETSSLDLFALYNFDDNILRWGTDRSKHGLMSGIASGAEPGMDDWGYGAVWNSKLAEWLPYQVFLMQKNTMEFKLKGEEHPWTQRELLGTKLMPQLNEEWSLQLEGMGQVGCNGDGDTLSGWSTYAGVNWKSSAARRPKPFAKLGYHYMSGDDDAATEDGGHDAWDPMWARGVNDCEMFLYGSHYGVGWWSNMHFLKLTAGLEFSRAHQLVGCCGPMFAASQDGLGGGDGFFKGMLWQGRYDFPIRLADRSKGERFEVVGHLLAELFNPGDYFDTEKPAWFFRWQLEFKF